MAFKLASANYLKIGYVILSAVLAAIGQMWPDALGTTLFSLLSGVLTGGALIKRPGDVSIPAGTATVAVPVKIDPQTLITHVEENVNDSKKEPLS